MFWRNYAAGQPVFPVKSRCQSFFSFENTPNINSIQFNSIYFSFILSKSNTNMRNLKDNEVHFKVTTKVIKSLWAHFLNILSNSGDLYLCPQNWPYDEAFSCQAPFFKYLTHNLIVLFFTCGILYVIEVHRILGIEGFMAVLFKKINFCQY